MTTFGPKLQLLLEDEELELGAEDPELDEPRLEVPPKGDCEPDAGADVPPAGVVEVEEVVVAPEEVAEPVERCVDLPP